MGPCWWRWSGCKTRSRRSRNRGSARNPHHCGPLLLVRRASLKPTELQIRPSIRGKTSMATLGHHVTGIDVGTTSESGISAVSWPAVFGGAFAATGVSVILAGIGAGLGLASASVWHHRGVSATTFTAMTAAWLVLTQWVASGCGGY